LKLNNNRVFISRRNSKIADLAAQVAPWIQFTDSQMKTILWAPPGMATLGCSSAGIALVPVGKSDALCASNQPFQGFTGLPFFFFFDWLFFLYILSPFERSSQDKGECRITINIIKGSAIASRTAGGQLG
jgi:hypothetical protein